MVGHKSSAQQDQQGVKDSKTTFIGWDMGSFPDGFGGGFLVL